MEDRAHRISVDDPLLFLGHIRDDLELHDMEIERMIATQQASTHPGMENENSLPHDEESSSKAGGDSNGLQEKMLDFQTQNGKNLLELSHESPVLLIFLRHLGCTFCRESLSDVADKKDMLKEKGIHPVFVHMSDEENEVEALFSKYNVEEMSRISDPQRNLYRSFGLKRGTIRQVIGPKVMWRGFVTSILKGYGFGMPKQDPLQLPGVFLVHRGKILKDFRAKFSSDRPDYSLFGGCEGC